LTSTSRRFLIRLSVFVLASLVAAVVLNHFHISAQPASRSDKVEAWITSGDTPISIGGITIKATEVLFKNITPLQKAKEACGTDNQRNVPHTGSKLNSRILVLKIDEVGRACVPEYQTRRFRSINVEALVLSATRPDSSGKPMAYTDGTHPSFQKIGLWREANGWDDIRSGLANILAATGLGALTTIVTEWLKPKSITP